MAVTKVVASGMEGGVVVNDIVVLGEQAAYVADDAAAITDSTTGTSTGSVCNDTTASVKDDLAVIIRKVNRILAVLKAHGLLASA